MTPQHFPKFSLHREGGSAAGAFDQGVNQELENIGVHRSLFSYTAATSASCANAVGFHLGLSHDKIWDFWKEVVPSEGFYNPKQNKLRLAKLKAHFRSCETAGLNSFQDHRILIPLYNIDKQRVDWFDSQEDNFNGRHLSKNLVLRIMIAAMALPGMHRPIRINGNSFMDPGLAYQTVPFPEHLSSDYELIIRTEPRYNFPKGETISERFKNRYKDFTEGLWEKKYYLGIRENLTPDYSQNMRRIKQISDSINDELKVKENQGKALVLRPDYKPRRRDFSLGAIEESREHGIDVVQRNKQEIQEFMKLSPKQRVSIDFGRNQKLNLEGTLVSA